MWEFRFCWDVGHSALPLGREEYVVGASLALTT